MKKAFILSLLLISALTAYCQSGPVAHWDMNGTTNDVTGSGHDGHGNNLTPAMGIDGVMGHAWYFDGTSSSISVPYMPDMNMSNGFTITATFMVKGFYTNTCHGNVLLIRGKTSVANGSYFLQYTDYPAGYGCTPTIDTNQESFMGLACSSSIGLIPPAPFTAFNDTPHVMENKWYTLVMTFDDTAYRIYVNDTLKRTVASTYPGVLMGSSTDSIGIGYAPYDAPIGYPYYFKGIMDDMRLYDRALSPCEVSKVMYSVTSMITRNPTNDTVAAGGIAAYSIKDTGYGATYQWQVDAGAGFVNITTGVPYSGITTLTLTASPVSAAMNHYHYRCIRTSSYGCMDTSASAGLFISTVHVNSVLSARDVDIVPNPASHMVSISSAAIIERIDIMNLLGQKLLSQQPFHNSVSLSIEDLPSGIYLVRINDSYTARLVKR